MRVKRDAEDGAQKIGHWLLVIGHFVFRMTNDKPPITNDQSRLLLLRFFINPRLQLLLLKLVLLKRLDLLSQLELWSGREVLDVVMQIICGRQRLASYCCLTANGRRKQGAQQRDN